MTDLPHYPPFYFTAQRLAREKSATAPSAPGPLAHRWRASARDGSWWVDHTTGAGNTIDTIEVPSGGTIGPLSKKAAQAVAAELNAALTIGREQGRRYWRKDWPSTEG